MQTLTFQNITLSPTKIDNQIWLTSGELAKALNYADTQSVTKIYERNADEFTTSMTTIAEVKTNGGMQKMRIFSLRGCHLIAMFARTKVAKDFRKWVLDILDKEVGQPVQVEQRATISIEQQAIIRQAVAKRCKSQSVHYQTIYEAIKKAFDIPRYDELLAVDFAECMALIENIQLQQAIDHQPFNIHDYLNQQSNQVMDYVHQLEYAVFELTGKYPQRPFNRDDIAKGVIGACLNHQTIELNFSESGLGFNLVDRATLRIHGSNIAEHIKLGNVNKKYLDDIIQASVSRLA